MDDLRKLHADLTRLLVAAEGDDLVEVVRTIIQQRDDIAVDIGMLSLDLLEFRDAAAEIAGSAHKQYTELKQAHERNSPTPFNPEIFGISMDLVKYSKSCSERILGHYEKVMKAQDERMTKAKQESGDG